MNVASAVEAPSGKWSGDENFPVGSWLLPAPLRPHVAVFYAVARTTDDIADNPDLTPEDKLARLDGFEQAVRGDIMDDPAFVKSLRLRRSLIDCNVTDQHIRDLIAAFKQDAIKSRYDDWDDLIAYCNLSAAPVGRYLLDLHGEDPADYEYSDPLCNALQVLNHLQDLKQDYLELDRVYLPGDWMEQNNVSVSDLAGDTAGAGLRNVIDKALSGVDDMLARARILPRRLKSRRLAMESAVIVGLADRLTALLRRGDPIAGRIGLNKFDFLNRGLRGMASVWIGGKS